MAKRGGGLYAQPAYSSGDRWTASSKLPAYMSKGLSRTRMQARHHRSNSGTGIETPRGANDETLAPDWSEGKPGHGEPTLWTHYNNKARHYDDDLVKDLNNTLDTLLLFAGLFSAAVSAIISLTYPLLQQDMMGSILREMQKPGSTLNDSFTAPPYAVRVNGLLFISLFTSMVVALLAILVKQWTRGYQRDLQGVSSPHLLARTRHFRYTGAHHWYFSECVSGLSVIMHLALFIAATGILDLLQAASRTLAYICLTVPVFGAVVFFGTTIIAALAEEAPYRTPLATGVSRILRRAQRIRTPPSKPEDGDGLEDELLYPDNSARDENVLVRKKHHLDLDIITHLLCQADKSTERGILDDCFRKLPQLAVLSDRSPGVVLDRHDELFKVYRFLANGCIIEKKNIEEIASNRLERARLLCSFLAWYLSLQRSQQQRERLQWYFNQWKDCYKLPETLGEDPQTQLTSFIPATRAIARLDHLIKQKSDRTDCAICDDACEEWRTHYDSVVPGGLSAAQHKQLIRDTTALLVSVTDCLVFRANFGYLWDGNIAAGSNKMVEILRHGSLLYRLSTAEKKDWEAHLKQAKDRAHNPSWIDDALVVLRPVT